ncbi:hypothetical protein AZE42_13150 [Rhizopogon vesiculosus]|uniref:Uncharacterized protein n=1 Tax=Rhizopogon vesiculosus TaxID=180088 RepID=A0A1J8QBM6_9AGAM|nr:hypothetical protein AZE42_13150 [Rhizopogon vesiculosus]
MLQLFLQRVCCKPETEQPDLLQKCLKEVVRVLNKKPDAERFHPSGIKAALDSFASDRIETTSYGPFVEASNIALKCLAGLKVKGMLDANSDLDIICQVNDYPIHQDHQGCTSKQKPDVVILPLKCAFTCLPGVNVDTVADDYKHISAAKKRFFWEDMLACIEFKRPTKKLSKCPPCYEVAPYMPTHPEYRRVEPPEPDTPVTAAADSAQTPATLSVPEPEQRKWCICNADVKLNQLS